MWEKCEGNRSGPLHDCKQKVQRGMKHLNVYEGLLGKYSVTSSHLGGFEGSQETFLDF